MIFMKEIPINDKALMVVTDNAISFHYKTSLLDKIAFICASILAMVVLCGFLLITSICFRELLKSPDLLLAVVFVIFGAGAILLCFIMLHFFISIFSYCSRIEIDNGVMSCYLKRILSSSRTLGPDDYVIINFTYDWVGPNGAMRYHPYGIAIRLKQKRGFGHFFLWRTILNASGMDGQKAVYRMSCMIEKRRKEIFPNLAVVNQCRERSSWREGDR